MVSGTDEHGTPILVAADAEGASPGPGRRPLHPDHRRGPPVARALVRPVHPDHHPQPLRGDPGALPRPARATGTSSRRRRSARSRRPPAGRCPDRYIEGTCPICGYDAARGDQCDNCGNQLDPTDLIDPRSRINGETPVFVEAEHYFLDLPAFAEVLGGYLQSRDNWRPNVLKFSLNLLDDLRAAGDHPGPRLGRPGAAGRLAGPAGQEALRLVRRGRSATCRRRSSGRSGPATRTRGGRSGRATGAAAYYFMGKDNIVFHAEIWPAMLFGYSGIGARGGTPGLARSARPAVRGGLQRVPDHGGQAVLLLPRGGHLHPRPAVPVRRGRAALLPVRGRAGVARTPTSPGRSSAAATTTSWPTAGATWSTGRSRWPPATSARCRRAGALTDADAALLAAVEGRLRHGRRAARAVPAEGGDRRGDAGRRRRQPLPVRPGAVEAAPSPAGPADLERMGTILHTALQVVDDCKTLLTPFLPSSSAQGARAARRRGASGRRCRRSSRWTSRPRPGSASYPVITGDYDTGARWESVPLPAGRPLGAPTPLFRKLDESIVDDELARLAESAGT